MNSRMHQQQRHSHMASTFTQHYDDTVVPSPLSFSPQNSVSAASTFSRATRSSSGNNSAATAIRLGSSSSINNKTWNGRMGAGRRLIMPHNESYRQSNSYSSSRPSVLQQRFDYNDEEDTQDVGTNNEQFCEENEEEQYIHSHNRLVYTTMKRGQKTRGGIPWMSTTNLNNDMNESSSSSSQTSHQKTLAQIERDRYLESNKNYI
ncbi:hypothetical protein BDF20DRAFT_895784 [Mycotypha africana]|uniref:uncharacterized protein n=1 Tax=Mycotypha africana TaxID=64632 RepID=UPI00230150EC|nr:uncharacterized protein BDF20DRAFT_895784 [Mycotypha africana]KAI8968335.1 hypothetical protein BDF20DRAFT_895784 [Mycotypha africana]